GFTKLTRLTESCALELTTGSAVCNRNRREQAWTYVCRGLLNQSATKIPAAQRGFVFND
ncbi:unnamed protein product, partial [Hymenolepis diminuta]